MPSVTDNVDRRTDSSQTPVVGGPPAPKNGVGLKFDHLEAMLTDIGVWQHANGPLPDKRHGYSIDDEARALIVALSYARNGENVEFNERMARTCFRFIEQASLTTRRGVGTFHNFCDQDGHWLDSMGSEDSFGRTLWGLGVAYEIDAPFVPRSSVEPLLTASIPHVDSLQPLRSNAFSILGLAACRLDDARLTLLADRLAYSYDANADPTWHWFENALTYCNARLPHALFAADQTLCSDRYKSIAVQSLDFLLGVMHNEKGSYSPIGNAPKARGNWYRRGDAHPPLFDQQPVDAGALVECCVAAYQATSEPRFRKAAYDAYAWYFGDNVHGLPVYDQATGGVADALTSTGINSNMGAESVLSIHMAGLALQTIDA